MQSVTARAVIDDDRLASDGPSTHALLERRQEQAGLSRAVGTLDGRLRDLVVSHYVEGESLSNIGRRFRVSPSRMTQLHGRALQQLRRCVEVST
jgi:DNA-directed RNA polymerase specialized sigma subunit